MIKVVEELAAVIPPPVSPRITIDTHERLVELFDVFGTRLPEDFIQFHRAYGEGCFFSVSHKTSANLIVYGNSYRLPRNDGPALREAATKRLNELRLVKEARPKRVPYPLFCEPGGLLPWATTTNGVDLCWQVRGDLVDDWKVVALRSGTGEHQQFDVGVAGFLRDIITGRSVCEFLPKGFPGEKGVGWMVAGGGEETFSRQAAAG